MKKITTVVTMMAILSLSVVAASWAQPGFRWRGSGGWGLGSQYMRMYDPKTQETIRGEVVSVESFTPMAGTSSGVHVMVKTDKETVPVHLGPAWYLENQDTKIEPKDTIEVKGSRITFDGKPAIVAAEIKKGEELLRLRDASGYPAWSGWRRG